MKNQLAVYEVQELPVFTIGRETKLQKIQRQCGTFQAARYLRNRGMTLQQSLSLLNR